MFGALLAYPQEVLYKRHLVYCVRIISVGCGTQYTKFLELLETCRGPWFPINWMKSASRWFHYTDSHNLFWAAGLLGPKPPLCWGFEIAHRNTTLGRTPSGWVIGLSQRRVPDNRHAQETDIHLTGGIRTHNPSKQAALDLCVRSQGHRGPVTM
jgi:hypothetical protein